MHRLIFNFKVSSISTILPLITNDSTSNILFTYYIFIEGKFSSTITPLFLKNITEKKDFQYFISAQCERYILFSGCIYDFSQWMYICKEY